MIKSAIFSIHKKYRYSLRRRWYGKDEMERIALFVMLNPSTADDEIDDPTIRRCIHFTKKAGCNSLEVVNLYAFKTSSPKELWAKKKLHINIIGSRNNQYIKIASDRAHHVVLAWGANAIEEKRIDDVIEILGVNQGSWPLLTNLGELTKKGFPRHPLYLKNETNFHEF